MYNMTSIIQCIRCNGEMMYDNNNYSCELCNYKYPVKDGILLTDTTKDTFLDIKGYIDEKKQDRPIVNFIDFIQAMYTERGQLRALEVAGGPGNLTKQVLEYNYFSELWSSDISVAFLEYQQKYIVSECCKFIQMNASNTFPFVNNSLDIVYGNSCLHHFLHYEKTLSECFRVLKPGGIAIFGEPISTGIQPLMLMLSLIAEIDHNERKPIFTLNEYKRIKQIPIDSEMLRILATTKQYDKLGKFEDKYQYNIEELTTLAKTIGFSSFQTIKDINPSSFLYNPTVQTYIEQIELFIQTIINKWKIPSQYMWIVEEVYSNMVKPNLGTNHCALFTVFCMKK